MHSRANARYCSAVDTLLPFRLLARKGGSESVADCVWLKGRGSGEDVSARPCRNGRGRLHVVVPKVGSVDTLLYCLSLLMCLPSSPFDGLGFPVRQKSKIL